jgi:hypothetical protein
LDGGKRSLHQEPRSDFESLHCDLQVFGDAGKLGGAGLYLFAADCDLASGLIDRRDLA